ncbi:hypothetical protein Pmar_PMAR015320 [Perkinsus marinus ATCC 50983]|uniref:Uncharacterized protein n=1 Tax=Perkinsus marinus (strain ATCC 50983 / TXsc) TaxID=423536 RepID=C5KLA2_PERM5|nr:hypothetical protein Pmar_PMAR015320 [Perkinsus marinus ATCC 50983]EER14775.1 hypothetical protein Pmar_PMAR015320 [Perkinsus marinus ATCC 50983]|eukprot:XP_002782979.1 hypothetical protein Pmar_PMAR015320 [Perkinsus marinus ATCC 50983]
MDSSPGATVNSPSHSPQEVGRFDRKGANALYDPESCRTKVRGWAVKDMYYHKDETTENTVVEEQLIQHWLKLIQNRGNETRGNISRYIKATAEDMRQAS